MPDQTKEPPLERFRSYLLLLAQIAVHAALNEVITIAAAGPQGVTQVWTAGARRP